MNKANKLLEMMVFTMIVDEGSFVAAANKLKLSKQAISRYLNDLETRLHVRLLQRTTRKISLTHEGQDFYQLAKNIISSVEEAESIVHLTHANPSGLLRVNVPLSYGIHVLAPLWQKFRDKYPNIELDISLSDRTVNLLEEGYDLAVRIGKLDNSSLISRKLSSTRIMLSASPQYLEKYGAPEFPNDLQKHQIIMYSQSAKQDKWLFEQDKKIYPVHLKAKVYCNNGDTCRMMLLADGGISLQPDFIIGEDIEQGRLVEVLPDYKIGQIPIHAVYPSRKLLPLRTKCLIDFFIEQLS
ncbi:LysR family transcriptional regulator [Utexia brackfieldae]|uniref:LysR family transcriptional regulator n=1 Tax=Utexia brackfieldae TaxID=3074108 RepID=UPI00370DE26E